MSSVKEAVSKDVVKKVAKAAGWMQFKAKREIEAAQAFGIDPGQYLSKRCWKKSPDELKELGERLEQQRLIQKEHAQKLSETTGWSLVESDARLKEARSTGITFTQYMNNYAYELETSELPRLARVLKAARRRREDNRSFTVDMIVGRSGWTRSYVLKRLEEAKEKDINILNYFYNSCWTKDAQQLETCSKLCKELHEGSQGKREKCLNYIYEQTEWSKGETALHTLEAFAETGCSIEDYARCHMWDMTVEQQNTFINGAIFRNFRIQNNDFQIGSPIFDYKDTFENVFNDLVSRRHFSFDSTMTKGEFINAIRGLSYIVIKPIRGTYGRGIEILPCNESYLQNGELYEYLVKIGRPLVIEEKIEQCDVLNELCPNSVNTLRVVTLLREGQTHVLQCVLRCGVGEIVDNIHAGGLVIEVDPQTGICKGDAVDYFGNLVEKHPITGVTFKGLKIPNIDDVMTLAEEASRVVAECKLIGWDIAVTQTGADLVEGNLKADYDAGQMAHLGVSREGLRATMVAPYVNPSFLGHSYIKDIEQYEKDARLIDHAEFKFSVIMPVYNAEKYLDEVMESLLNQTIGFQDNIQVILVNDGSPDDSAAICRSYEEQYPNNVVFVDKENGGPSSARNAGIPHASGAFINFLDPDDKWAKDAFEIVWKFIRNHKGEIDVVGCRQKYFEARNGYHKLDYKFKDGNRIIDINKDPDCVQLSATSAFIAASAFDNHAFDDRISLGDDSKLLTEVILDKKRYGVCASAIHHFRKREDSSSITQNKSSSKKAYIDTIKYYYSFIADYSEEKFGRILPYVQHCLVNGLKYRAGKPVPEILDEKEGEWYRLKIENLISQLYDGVLLEARNASPSLKLYMMHLKKELPANVIAHIENGDVWVNDGMAFKITGNGFVSLNEMRHEDGSFVIDGLARIPGFVDTYRLTCETQGQAIEIPLNKAELESKLGITNEKISMTVPFSFDVPISKDVFDIRIFAEFNGDAVCLPLTLSKGSDLHDARKGEARIGDYSISRHEKTVLKVKKN